MAYLYCSMICIDVFLYFCIFVFLYCVFCQISEAVRSLEPLRGCSHRIPQLQALKYDVYLYLCMCTCLCIFLFVFVSLYLCILICVFVFVFYFICIFVNCWVWWVENYASSNPCLNAANSVIGWSFNRCVWPIMVFCIVLDGKCRKSGVMYVPLWELGFTNMQVCK